MSKKSSTFAPAFQKLEFRPSLSGAPKISNFWESGGTGCPFIKRSGINIATLLPNAKVSLAQLVEQLTLNQWVEGSSPSGDTRDAPRLFFFIFLILFNQYFSAGQPHQNFDFFDF